jgi:hypothetical protein
VPACGPTSSELSDMLRLARLLGLTLLLVSSFAVCTTTNEQRDCVADTVGAMPDDVEIPMGGAASGGASALGGEGGVQGP